MYPSVLVSLALSVGAPALKPQKPDPPKIHGEWVVTEYILSGNPVPGGVRVEFGPGGRAVFVNLTGERTEGMYTVDPGKAPAEVDITFPGGPASPMIGIYKADREALVICFADRDRPKEFRSPAGRAVGLLTLTRVNKKD